MASSGNLENLCKALVAAQAEAAKVAVPMEGFNKFFGSKYATLESLVDVMRKVFPNNGLSLSQFPISDEDKIGLRNYLMHQSGEYIYVDVFLPVRMTERTYNKAAEDFIERDANYLQEAGKILTYLRRYSIQGILGVYGDEDIDGNDQEQQAVAKPAAVKPVKPDYGTRPYDPHTLKRALALKAAEVPDSKVTDKQRNFLGAIISQVYPDEDQRHIVQTFLFGEPSVKDIAAPMVRKALDWLDPKKDEAGNYVINQTSQAELVGVWSIINKGLEYDDF